MTALHLKWTLQSIVAVALLVISVGGLVWAAGVSRQEVTEAKERVEAVNEASLKRHEAQSKLITDLKRTIENDHDTLLRVENDVKWIRQQLEHAGARGPLP